MFTSIFLVQDTFSKFLLLNCNKTHFLQFNTKNCRKYVLKLNYQGNYVKCSPHTKFLSLIIDDSLSWKAHIDQIMSKLNTVCFVIWTLQTIMPTETLKMVCFAYVRSIMSYKIIFGGNQPYSEKIFKIQKRVIRNITKSRMKDSCRELFQRLKKIFPIPKIYFLSINTCDKKQTLCNTNNQIHSVHTIFKTNLHPPTANLTKFQKGVYYLGIKIFNNLPHDIKRT